LSLTSSKTNITLQFGVTITHGTAERLCNQLWSSLTSKGNEFLSLYNLWPTKTSMIPTSINHNFLSIPLSMY